MASRPKILLVDDEPKVLETFKELLSRLPSRPEIFTANSSARALALLDLEPFSLLIMDLKMPKIDGFQALMIVRRKHPWLRTVVLTGVADEHYRARTYAIGVDLYFEKPRTAQEIKLFTDCIESLLGRDEQSGFRGVQSKSLHDLIQLECLTQSSVVLKVAIGALEGRIWIQDGEVIDASVGGESGEVAFKQILSWKAGHFEILPGESGRKRVIFTSYQGLLLDSAQSEDERTGNEAGAPGAASASPDHSPDEPLMAVARMKEVDFVLSLRAGKEKKVDSWGVEDSDRLAAWTGKTMQALRQFGDQIHAGALNGVEGFGLDRHVGLLPMEDRDLCVGLQRDLKHHQVREVMNEIKATWVT